MTDHMTIPAVDIYIRAELVRLVSDCQCDRYWPWHEGGVVPHVAGGGERERGVLWHARYGRCGRDLHL